MAQYPGFVGSSARVRSVNVGAERTINWLVERPPGHPAAQETLVPTPGLEPFTVLPTGPIRAVWAMDGRAFAVGGTGFFELFASGTATLRGTVNQNAFPATISGNGANGQQLLVTSAGINWIYDLEANTFTLVDITNPPTPTRMSLFSDGYFIALKANTNQFNISALYDGTTWDPLDVFQVSTVADQVQAIIETHRDLWLLGTQTSSVWSNTGDEIVYQPVPGVKIDQGCAAAFSAVRIDNAIMWLGQSEAGDRVVWRADGYTPRRVSTHAVEYALGQAPRVDDAMAWAYQQEGHLFYVLYVPGLADVRDWGTTWVYDVATDQWHERALWDTTLLQWQPHLGRCHAFGFGRHLVGARDSGAIYDMRLDMAHDTVVLGAGSRPAVPTLTSITPATGVQGATVAVTLVGTGFVAAGTTVVVSGADVVVSDVIVSSTTQLAADVWIAPDATVGERSVSVTTTEGTSNSRPFTVTAAVVTPGAPTLTSVTPDTGVQGTTVPVALVGTGFVVGATTVAVSGTGVTVSAVVVSSPTALTADLVLAVGATVSGRSVTVTTAAGTSSARPFTVTAAPGPTLTSVSPTSGDQGDTVSVTLVGTGFVIGATTVAVSGTGVTVSAVVVASSTSLTADFGIAVGATLSARSVTVTTATGTSSARTFTVTDPGVPAGDYDQLVASDLTLAGMNHAPDSTYANIQLAYRYVGAERRILLTTFSNHVIEYTMGALKNGGAHWVLGSVPALTEVRRWNAPSWHTAARMVADGYPSASDIFSGNGAWVASTWWDERSGLLWYAWQPKYPGGSIQFALYGAVRLTDAESSIGAGGGTVTDAHLYGPYYFKDGTYNDFKGAAAGIIPIPADQQAGMGGAFLVNGHHCANIGSGGARGMGLYVVSDVPTTPPAEGAMLFPTAVHIWDTSPDAGIEPYGMKIPNVSYQMIGHAGQGGSFSFSAAGGAASGMAEHQSVGTTVNDALYNYDYGAMDGIVVLMHTPASGGAFVPEYWNGSAWVQPAGWAMAAGTTALSATENCFYWPQGPVPSDIDIGFDPHAYLRVRRTVAGTSGGAIRSIYPYSNLTPANNTTGDRPATIGGVNPVSSFQYDATHYAWSYENFFWGSAWVQNDVVNGLIAFGPISVGGQYYGAAPVWAKQPAGLPTSAIVPSGVEDPPVRKYYAFGDPNLGNGGKGEGPQHPFAWTFDTTHLMEVAAGTGARNANGLQPAAFTDMLAQWPDLIVPDTLDVAASPYVGYPTFAPYGSGNSVVYDPTANQVLVVLSNGDVWQEKTIIAVFDVRNA